MRWRPFHEKPLVDVSVDDLEQLRDEGIEEGLFLEYKSEWNARQIARSVAAFANTEGGTLIVGMKTVDRTPVELVGFEHAGDIGESIDNVIRGSIAPRPTFGFKEIVNREGKPCLVVEVPRDESSRPFLLTRTGQVMRRTQTGTEPATRDYLDQLFLEGRSGERWARDLAASELEEYLPEGAKIWTIPVVEGGLSVGTTLFTESFLERLNELAARFTWVGVAGGSRVRHVVGAGHLEVSRRDPFDGAEFHLRAEPTGVVTSSYTPQQISDADALEYLKRMIDLTLGMHQSLLVDSFGFHGRMLVALRNIWNRQQAGGEILRHVSFAHPDFVLADELASADLAESLKRQAGRSLGYLHLEPGA